MTSIVKVFHDSGGKVPVALWASSVQGFPIVIGIDRQLVLIVASVVRIATNIDMPCTGPAVASVVNLLPFI